MLFPGILKRKFLTVEEVFGYIFRNIKSRAGDVEVASSLSGIDLEELELSVTGVVFYVEIGKSHIVHGL